MLTMDGAMHWDGQRAHALRAMATLRGRSSATRRTAPLAARPDRARAHVQQGTAVRTVLQVGSAWLVNVHCALCVLLHARPMQAQRAWLLGACSMPCS